MWFTKIRFTLLEHLGEGSQGSVFRALRTDPASGLKQNVAVKILHSETAVELWRAEFESLARVRSPYCLQVLSFERVRRRPALILELIEGTSLTELGRAGWLQPEEVDELVAQIQVGLEDLAAYGVFHGDLSPHNVMLDQDGRVRLLDFGLANSSGRLTPEFAAPERLSGARADFASDLFALGRVEEFLRGVSLPLSPLLRQRPEDRQVQSWTPQPERQSALALRLRHWRARQSSWSTRSQVVLAAARRSLTGLLARVLFCIGVCALTSGATAGPPVAAAFLSLRTRAWHGFLLDGVPVGYAPLNLRLRAGAAHRLDWFSASGRGHRWVQLGRDGHLILSDRDFLH